MSRMTPEERAKVFANPSPWSSLFTRLTDRITKHRGKSINMAGQGDILDFVRSIGVAATAP
jgi:hypothetical protein